MSMCCACGHSIEDHAGPIGKGSCAHCDCLTFTSALDEYRENYEQARQIGKPDEHQKELLDLKEAIEKGSFHERPIEIDFHSGDYETDRGNPRGPRLHIPEVDLTVYLDYTDGLFAICSLPSTFNAWECHLFVGNLIAWHRRAE